jgi:mannitol operon transcriptional antiterminator
MNKRSREILSQLITKTEYNQTISIQELADTFKVSSRTILIRSMII